MNKWSELFVGLILVIGAILIAFASAGYLTGNEWIFFGKSFNFLTPAWDFLKGGLFWFVTMIGLLFIMLGISDLKE